jgi:hypothetical protein
MSKGSGGGGPAQQPQTSTVNQSNLPEYAEPFFTRLMERAEEQSNTDYTPYEGSRLAGFGADTEAGFANIRSQAQAGTPASFTTAENTLSGVAQADPMAQQAQFGDTRQFTDEGVAQSYMNPYVTNVLNTQQQRLGQRFDEAQAQRDMDRGRRGAFSNTRRGVADSIAQRELDLQRNEMDAKGYAAAYESGANVFNQDRAADLQNRALQTDVFQGNRQGILGQQKLQAGAAEQLRAQGLAGEELAMGRAKSLAGLGGAYDTQTQQQLDTGYSDFLNQRDYDRNQLNYYSGILRGVPISPTQESTTYNAPPSQLSQLLGLGVGGLGLAKAFGS